VENLEVVTKDDMLEFYHTYFSPASETRAKVSVHMIAQASAEDIGNKMDPKQQRQQLAETLASVLSQLGIEADAAKLDARLEKVDVQGGNVDGIVSASVAYLQDDAGANEEQVAAVQGQAPVILAQILPQLGIKSKAAEVDANGDAARNGAKVVKKNKSMIIDDMRAWKASMPLSRGPKAVKELSAFEELEPKL
jgi:insulysin